MLWPIHFAPQIYLSCSWIAANLQKLPVFPVILAAIFSLAGIAKLHAWRPNTAVFHDELAVTATVTAMCTCMR